jgi:predicted phage tail component-like protein
MEYNGQDLYAMAFLRVFSHKIFSPEKKPRKLEIDTRSGAFDYGANWHKERTITIVCLIERPISTAQFDNLKYALSKKGRIVFWDEPDRYYLGECYNPAELEIGYNDRSKRFTLEFICEPYAIAYDFLTKSGKISRIQSKTPLWLGTCFATAVWRAIRCLSIRALRR